jgi:hypothetical protein
MNPPHHHTTGAIRHPLNHTALYTPDEHNTVLVTMGRRWGRFRANGQWLEGPLFEADPEMCLWISSPRPTNHHRTSHIIDIPTEP